MLLVNNITKYYGKDPVLNGISFQVEQGETTGIFGQTTSGKTTLMDILSGYMLNYKGSVELRDSDGKLVEKPFSYISYIPKGIPMYDTMTGEEYFDFIAGINGIKKKRKRSSETDWFSFAGLSDSKTKYISELSQYERMKLSVISYLSIGTRVLLIDEPYFGMKVSEIEELSVFLRAVALKTTLIVTSSTITGFSQLCKRTIIINQGRIVSNSRGNFFNSGGRRNYIKLRMMCDQAKARAIFRFVSGISDLDFKLTDEKDAVEVIINAENGIDIRSTIWEAVVNSKVPLLEMRTLKVSSEDIYLQLSGKN